VAWRVLEIGDTTWKVSIAAERRANSDQWGLVFSFREAGPNPRRFWAPYPIQSASKAALFSQAEKLADRQLVDLLTQRLAER